MNKYGEYEQIKAFIEKRIFQEQTMKEHRAVLQTFIEKFLPEMAEKLLIVWKLFLNLVNFQIADKSREDFYEKLGMELKKRIEYRVLEHTKKSGSEIYRKAINEG